MVKEFDLSGRVAVVTGAAGNLGSFWTATLLQAGASVAALDLPDAPVSRALADLLASSNGRGLPLQADVRDRDSLETAARRCAEKLGAPDILVNNAGIDNPPTSAGKTYRTEDYPYDLFGRVLDINVRGLFQAAQVFGGDMVRRGRGSIINIASLYAHVSPDPRLYEHLEAEPPFLKPPAYGASKAAVANLTRYLAAHWGPHGVRVNTISPGGVEAGQDEEFRRKYSERVPLRRMARREDLAGPLLFLASDASAYVTGHDLVVDGGFTAW